nr:MAG TPA: leucine-rich repeat protein [Caudoviricetes sp.]
MGKVYLGDKCIDEMYTQQIVEYKDVIVDVLKNPISRYFVDENGIAKMIEGDLTNAFDDGLTVDEYGLYYAFYGCTRLTGSIDFPELTSVGEYGLSCTFDGCTGLTGSVSFPKLTSVRDYGLRYAFNNCTGLTGSVSFPELTSIGSSGLSNAFDNCKGLTGSVSFPKLTSVGDYGLSNAFNNCKGLTEIHFRADVKATIEAQYSYSSKFGATNATIYFDL